LTAAIRGDQPFGYFHKAGIPVCDGSNPGTPDISSRIAAPSRLGPNSLANRIRGKGRFRRNLAVRSGIAE
jgi:hypothetical protein